MRSTTRSASFPPTVGRHPDDIEPSYLGDSVGRWEGDTLVVDVIGFNTNTWLVGVGTYHSEKLRVTERYTRDTHDTIIYEATMEDPEVLTKPWKQYATLRLRPGERIREYRVHREQRRHSALREAVADGVQEVARILELPQRSVFPGYSSLTSCRVQLRTTASRATHCGVVPMVRQLPLAPRSSTSSIAITRDGRRSGSAETITKEEHDGWNSTRVRNTDFQSGAVVGLRNTVGHRFVRRTAHRSSNSCSRCSSSCSSNTSSSNSFSNSFRSGFSYFSRFSI